MTQIPTLWGQPKHVIGEQFQSTVALGNFLLI